MTGPQYFRVAESEADAYVEGELLVGTSTTSVSIPTALGQEMTLTTDTGLMIDVNTTVMVAALGSTFGVNGGYAILRVTNYNTATGALTGWAIKFAGSGTFASWLVKVVPYSSFTDPSLRPFKHAFCGGI